MYLTLAKIQRKFLSIENESWALLGWLNEFSLAQIFSFLFIFRYHSILNAGGELITLNLFLNIEDFKKITRNVNELLCARHH